MCGFTGRVQACVTLHPSHPPTALPRPPQRGYSEREDEKAGTKQAALDGEPLGGGQLATIHLHPSEEQQGQERGKRQRRACAHHWSGGGETESRAQPALQGPRADSAAPGVPEPGHFQALRGLQPPSPNPHTSRRPPQESLTSGRPEPSRPRGNAHRLEPRTRQLCGQRTRKAGPPNSDPPLVRPGWGVEGIRLVPLPITPCPGSSARFCPGGEPNRGDGWLCACVRP